MKDNPQPLVVCEWLDAWVRGEESMTLADVAAKHKPELITTIGWLLREDAEGIMLANEFYADAYRGCTFVPRAMVKSINRFKLTKPKTSVKPKPQLSESDTPQP